ncbi:hypothetical protein ABCG99_01330 [Klebsiella pneumoniae]
MTVSTQVSRNEYTGNGATTQYDFTFRILDKSHLLVQTMDTSENIVTLTLGTDYTVTGVNRYNGGKVVLTSALPAGYKISIERSTPVTQEASIRNQGGFFPEIHEDALDKLTMLVQQAYGWWSGLSLRKPSCSLTITTRLTTAFVTCVTRHRRRMRPRKIILTRNMNLQFLILILSLREQ